MICRVLALAIVFAVALTAPSSAFLLLGRRPISSGTVFIVAPGTLFVTPSNTVFIVH